MMKVPTKRSEERVSRETRSVCVCVVKRERERGDYSDSGREEEETVSVGGAANRNYISSGTTYFAGFMNL